MIIFSFVSMLHTAYVYIIVLCISYQLEVGSGPQGHVVV